MLKLFYALPSVLFLMTGCATWKSADDFKATYMVIDISRTTSLTNYPVTYFASAEAVPGGVTNDIYKTSKLILRKIPAGTFTMGSPLTEFERGSDESQHTVKLTKDFYIGVFEVTQRQWQLVAGYNLSYFNNTNYCQTRPVERLGYGAIRGYPPHADWPSNNNVHGMCFMRYLRIRSGLSNLDLPTEAQWEYACRAGTTNALNNGKDYLTEYSADMSAVGRYWFNGGSGYNFKQDCNPSVGTAKVGSYLPNAWGLYDMHGNVREWCLDWFGPYPEDARNPKGPWSGPGRVLRGGCWMYGTISCRSGNRHWGLASSRDPCNGFRIAMTLP